MALAERTLPQGPDRVFAIAEPVLTNTFGGGTYKLGGGTGLAAVWHHRHSTDVDLFMDERAYRAVSMLAESRSALERQLRSALSPITLEIQNGFLKLVSKEGELSLSTTPHPLPFAPSQIDRIAGTIVEIEPPAIVIGRKIHGRMLSSGVFVLRDMYDIAAASAFAKEDLTKVLGTVSETDKAALRRELASLPRDWANLPLSGRPIINAVAPQALARNPGRSLQVVMQLLDDDWTLANQLGNRHPSTKPKGFGYPS